MTTAQVNKELAQEEIEDARQGEVSSDVLPSTFLRVGLQLEEQQ
jgi:hypothetical protein